MIVQACLNGARPAGYHPALPVTPKDVAADAVAAVAAGAAELHLHPRGADERETLSGPFFDATVEAVRAALPGTLIGVSTGAWIEGDPNHTRAAIAGWRARPDHASVNLSEPDAPAVMAALHARGIGIEAGLATRDDAARLLGIGVPCLRILLEIEGMDAAAARAQADAMAAIVAPLARPILLHGMDALVWPLVRHAALRRHSTRVGLEDGDTLPDGTFASGNAALVRAACAMLRP